jgi:hypothetical protein
VVLKPSALTRAGTAALGGLAVVHLVTALTSGAPAYALVLLVVGCVLSSASALALHRRGSVGARVAALAAAVLSCGGAVLVGTLGLPGRGSSGFGLAGTAAVLLALAVLLTLALDVRSRPASRAAVPPYAL